VTGDTLVLKRLEKSLFYFFFENALFIFQFLNKKQKKHLATELKSKVSPVTRHPKFLNITNPSARCTAFFFWWSS